MKTTIKPAPKPIPKLADRAALERNRIRARGAPVTFVHDIAVDEINDRLSLVNRRFTNPAIVTGFPQIWAKLRPDAVIVDDSEAIKLQPGAHDLVIHAMGLHWATDPVGQLIQCLRALRPDGLFLAVLFGGQTLHELRSALAEAESRITGGLSPRVAPMADIRDLGALLQRAGFALPVADSLPLTTSYKSSRHLMHELRAMGEGNALHERARTPTKPAIFEAASEIYNQNFDDGTGRINATFELVFLTGWAPDASQQQPLRPGSATTRLADALNIPKAPTASED